MMTKQEFISLGQQLAERADEQNDFMDHDELHAASDVCAILSVKEWMQTEYINRWLIGLKSR
jgi:hypothetical protein